MTRDQLQFLRSWNGTFGPGLLVFEARIVPGMTYAAECGGGALPGPNVVIEFSM